ncbi:general secretion pathway protein GspC [Nitrospira sp.]|nr:general secretion pathway protein GspC [Nitrospira sp.]
MTPGIRLAATSAFVALTAFLVSHILTGVISHALVPPLEYTAVSQTGQGVSGRTNDLPQFMRDIESSRLFAMAPVSASNPSLAPGQGPVAMGRAPLNVASRIRLLGTVVGDPSQSLAVVEELAGKKQGAYRVHDQIVGLGEVIDIRRESIVVGQNGLEEELFLDILQKPAAVVGASTVVPVGTSVAPTGGPLQRTVDRAELDQMLSDIPKLMTQARAMPNMNGGKMDGFRLEFIMKGSFFEKLGLQAGDVLQRINGVELRDPGMALSLFQQLRNERNVAVDVLRKNQRTTLVYDIRG